MHFVMEYYEVGTLSDLIEALRKFKLQIPEDRVWKIIAQFFIALSVMNDRNLAHRDVKDGNILIDEDDNIKVTDYGLSKELSFDSMKLNTIGVGTMFIFLCCYLSIFSLYRQYMAPEVVVPEFCFFELFIFIIIIFSNRYSLECDVWSFGIVLFKV
jgi:serine/threonine protein kinase